jgi:hypothetical protein
MDGGGRTGGFRATRPRRTLGIRQPGAETTATLDTAALPLPEQLLRVRSSLNARIHNERAGQMKTLVVVIIAVAVVLLIVGFAAKTLGFLIGVAPLLLMVIVVLLLVNRSGGSRIPR